MKKRINQKKKRNELSRQLQSDLQQQNAGPTYEQTRKKNKVLHSRIAHYWQYPTSFATYNKSSKRNQNSQKQLHR